MSRWTHFMIHHTASSDSDDMDFDDLRLFHMAKGWREIGYHFVVEKVFGSTNDYRVLMGRPLFMTGAHAGTTEWNRKAIGVALVGNFEKAPPPLEQLKATADLIRGLGDSLGIPIDREHIVRHGEHRVTACPGKFLNADFLVQLAQQVKVD